MRHSKIIQGKKGFSKARETHLYVELLVYSTAVTLKSHTLKEMCMQKQAVKGKTT